MKRAKHAKAMGATALIVAGSMLGCAAQGPANPGAPAPIGWSADAPNTLTPGRINPGAVPFSPEKAARPDALQNPAIAGGTEGTLTAPAPAPAVAVPEREEMALPAETLKYRAPINSLQDVLKQSGLGPVDEAQAPPADLVKRILPQRLSQAQAASLLVKVPANMVQIDGISDSIAGEVSAGSGGGTIAASSHRSRNDGPRQVSTKRNDRGQRGRSYDRDDRGGYEKVGGHKSSAGRGDKRGHGETRWSRFGHGDRDLVLASSFGWNQFIFGSSFFFFPATIFGALHFFPYTFASGFFYPAFCPFYFSAAFFIPYCQAPLVWYGTFGLVSGCPTCPISGRPLLWFPGEVPVI